MTIKESAQHVLDLLERGTYTAPSGRTVEIGDAQRAAHEGTRLYEPEELATLLAVPSPGGTPARIEVTDATTQVAARELASEGEVVLLNFASARNPGGGFLNGAKAQEEDLCRCSGLYPTLLTRMPYYDANRKQKSLHYTDHAIYSPGIPFFKVRGTGDFLEEPFRASVITAPAPNTGPILKREPEAIPAIAETFRRRWGNVLAIARDNGCRTILLGAWGCGAFQGDPAMAASTAAEWLKGDRFAGSFDRIVFAIPGQSTQSRRNLEAFRKRFPA